MQTAHFSPTLARIRPESLRHPTFRKFTALESCVKPGSYWWILIVVIFLLEEKGEYIEIPLILVSISTDESAGKVFNDMNDLQGKTSQLTDLSFCVTRNTQVQALRVGPISGIMRCMRWRLSSLSISILCWTNEAVVDTCRLVKCRYQIHRKTVRRSSNVLEARVSGYYIRSALWDSFYNQ